MKRNWMAIVLTAGVAAVGFNGCSKNSAVRVAPDFELMGMNGKMVELSEFRGRPVLVSFWGDG